MLSLSVAGVEVTIIDIQTNKKFICDNDCLPWCPLKKELSLSPTKDGFIAMTISFNVKNSSKVGWPIHLGDWQLIDTNGFSYRAYDMCDNLRPPRMMQPEIWEVSPGTQANFMLVFPELEKGKEIARVLYIRDDKTTIFKIKELTLEATKLLETKEKTPESELAEKLQISESVENDWEVRQLRDSIERLDVNIYSRLNNVLIPKEIQYLENTIRTESYRIEMKLNSLPKNRQDLLRARYNTMMTNYHSKVEVLREREKKVIDLNKKVESLRELTPREFEEYIAELFKVLGYENITLTPQVNDKGIDILMEKNGKKYAVQCKRFKGLVGSPAIQTFLGALQHAQASHGFFITTSTFSVEAERMAAEHPIELIDGIKLAQMIHEALGLR